MFELFRDPKIDFLGKTKIWVGLSLAAIVFAIGVLSTRGIHRGIEFTGGTEVQVQYPTRPDVGTVAPRS